MSEQRSRRAFLAAGGGVTLGGCVVLGTSPGLFGNRADGPVVDVLAAGSLLVTLDELVGPAFARQTAYEYRGQFQGSNAVMRLVEGEQKRPDVVVSADADLLWRTLHPEFVDWDAVVGANSVGVTYHPDTRVGQRLDAGEPWYEVLASGEADASRTDPNVDPLGYRTLMLFDLAADYYDRPGLAAELRRQSTVAGRESHLLADVATGTRPAAYCYRNMAADHDLPFVQLPAPLDFSDPTHADAYASESYTTGRGRTIAGSPVLYAVGVPNNASNPEGGRRFVQFLLDRPELLEEAGVVVPDALPQTRGRLPDQIQAAASQQES